MATQLGAGFGWDDRFKAEVAKSEHEQKLREMGLDSRYEVALRSSSAGLILVLIDKEAAPATKRQRRQRHPAAPVTVTRVDPRVHSEALRLAGGDASRIRIEGVRRVSVAQ